MDRNIATPHEKRLFSEAALRVLCSQFATPKTSLHKPLAYLLPNHRRPRMHMVFGIPCTGKSTLSKQLVRKCRRGATINMDYDNAVLDNGAYMSLQKAMGTGYAGHASILTSMADKVAEYWYNVFHAAADAAVTRGYDIIIHVNDTVLNWLAEFVYTTASKWEIYAHFTVAPTTYREACHRARLRTKTRIQLVQSPMKRDIFRNAGTSINFFWNEYSYMAGQTPHVFFYFSGSGQHLFHKDAVIKVDRKSMRMILQAPPVKVKRY